MIVKLIDKRIHHIVFFLNFASMNSKIEDHHKRSFKILVKFCLADEPKDHTVSVCEKSEPVLYASEEVEEGLGRDSASSFSIHIFFFYLIKNKEI